MMPTLYYFLQVIVCSAVLYVYYLLALRNKKFHQYNRFYLLSILLVSWLVPLIRIPVKAIASGTGTSTGTSFKFFEVIADNNTHMEEYISGSSTVVNTAQWLTFGYWSICIALAVVFITGMIRILMLAKRGAAQYIDGAVVIATTAKGAPFSFFHFIFWNNDINIESNVGKKILAHEMVHIKEKHTIDKIITAIAICVGWLNPVFWLTKRELDMVHEFIADNKAVNNDASELANMLLTASYPSMNFALTTAFFHSPIKRRISMMTKFSLTRYPYLIRLMVLPLIGMVVMLFAFRKEMADIVGIDPVNRINTEEKIQSTPEAVISDLLLKDKTNVSVVHDELSRVYNVIIDPGHGGEDKGAVGIDGTIESTISLQISKFIKELNSNSRLNIILTRDADTYMQPKDKAMFAVNNKADLFISIHANAQFETGVSTQHGIEVILPKKDSNINYKKSYILANSIGTYLEKLNPKTTLKTRKSGIWVLQHTNCPSALIECGYITNKKDLENLKSEAYQKKLAKRVLEATEHYLHYAEERT